METTNPVMESGIWEILLDLNRKIYMFLYQLKFC